MTAHEPPIAHELPSAHELEDALRDMTQRQREVLSFMRGFSDKHGAPPTVREIAERFRFTPRAAFDHLRALERKGMLHRRVTDKRVSRTLVLTDRSPERSRRDREIPILGKIAAGAPIFAAENREDVIQVRPEWLAAKGGEVFALRVRGDSMIQNPGFEKGNEMLLPVN